MVKLLDLLLNRVLYIKLIYVICMNFSLLEVIVAAAQQRSSGAAEQRSSGPPLYTRTLSGYDKVYSGYEFTMFSFSSLVWIHDLFYVNGVKIVPANLGLFFTPLTLAIWISDDGGWTDYGVKISTNSFSETEVQFLIDLLKKKFLI